MTDDPYDKGYQEGEQSGFSEGLQALAMAAAHLIAQSSANRYREAAAMRESARTLEALVERAIKSECEARGWRWDR